MRISKRTHLEVGALLLVIGICVVVIAAVRFDAFVDSDYRFRKEFEPYLITHALRNPINSADNLRMFQHRNMIYGFYPSGSPYSRCNELVVCSSGGLIVMALGSWVFMRARRRRDAPV